MKPTRSPDGRSTLGIWTDVSRAAILDAGLSIGDIAGLLIAQPITEQAQMWPSILGEYIGIHPKYGNIVDLGGASAAGMVWRAAAAIDAGICRAVLCVTGEASDVETFYATRSISARTPAPTQTRSSTANRSRWRMCSHRLSSWTRYTSWRSSVRARVALRSWLSHRSSRRIRRTRPYGCWARERRPAA